MLLVVSKYLLTELLNLSVMTAKLKRIDSPRREVKLALLVFNFIHDEEIRNLLESLNAPGFTEVPQAYGTGESGKRFASHAFPGHDTLIFSVMADNQAEALVATIERIKARLADRRRPGGIKLFLWSVERVV